MPARKVLFVTDRIGFNEPTSVPILSAMAKGAGHGVALAVLDQGVQKAIAAVRSFDPDILAYSISSFNADKYFAINALLKPHSRALSVFGGAHPTFFPECIERQGVDAVCIGEGDHAFVQFLDTLGSEAVYGTPNFWLKRPDGAIVRNPVGRLEEDLDALPFPDRELLFQHSFLLRNLPIRLFFAGRGCPFNCTYCFNHQLHRLYRGKGRILRTKSVGYLLREVKDITQRLPTRFIRFQDDIFGLDQDWLAEFAERYPREVGIPFSCQTRPNVVTPEFCQRLKAAGCHSLALGLEAGSERIRREVLGRKMSDQQIASALHAAKSSGLKIKGLNILGNPGETLEDIRKTLRMNQDGRVDFAEATICQPYPGTRLNQYCQEHGYLTGENTRWEPMFSSSILNLPQGFKQELVVYQRMFQLMVVFPGLERFVPLLVSINRSALGRLLIDALYRITYGLHNQGRIFPAKVPLLVRLHAAYHVLFSRERT